MNIFSLGRANSADGRRAPVSAGRWLRAARQLHSLQGHLDGASPPTRHTLASLLKAGLLISGLTGLLSACSTIEDDSANAWIATIEVHNPSPFARRAFPVHLRFDELGLLSGKTEQPLVTVVDDNVVASEQVDRNGDGNKDGLLTLLDFAPGETRKLEVRFRTERYRPVRVDDRVQAELAVKQGGQWVASETGGSAEYRGGKYKAVATATPPDSYTEDSSWVRNGGPALETDTVGYRFSLGERGGYRVYAKGDPALVLHRSDLDEDQQSRDSRPLVEELFELEGALGAGGFGYWRSGELKGFRQLDSRTVSVVDDGLLHASLRFEYFGWHLIETRLDATALLAIDAGNHLLHNQLSLSGDLPNLAVSLGERAGAELIEAPSAGASGGYTYVATWGNVATTGRPLGVAIFVRQRDLLRLEGDEQRPVVVLKPTRGRVDYYLAVVDGGSESGVAIASEQAFAAYLEETAAALGQPLYLAFDTAMTRAKTSGPLTAERTLYWAKAMADSELTRDAAQYRLGGWDPKQMGEPGFAYDTAGMLPLAIDDLGRVTGEERFLAYKRVATASYIRTDGAIARYQLENYDLGSLTPGRVLLRLAADSEDRRFQAALARLRDQLDRQPRVGGEGLAQHAQAPHQLWLAGVYMAMPFVAGEVEAAGSKGMSADILASFTLAREHLRDPATGLYHSAWDARRQQPWADAETGVSPGFKARDMGFLALALVDTLERMPPDPQARAPLLAMTTELARTLRDYRDAERKVWWQWLDQPGKTGNFPESSATAMFTCFLAKAIRLGYLTDEDFGGDANGFALEAFAGLIRQFVLVHPDGKISLSLQVAGLGPANLYGGNARVTDAASGTAAFILAAIEMHRLLAHTSGQADPTARQ